MLSPMFSHGVPIAGDAIKTTELLDRSIWIVLGKDKNDTVITQGTAFSLDGFGLVGARHVFSNPTRTSYTVHRWEVFNATKPSARYPVLSVRDVPSIDLTIIQSPAVHTVSLRRSTARPSTGDSLRVVGYPQWNSLGDKLSLLPCSVTQVKTVSGIRYILTNAHIREGNSGGPMLDDSGCVVGVVVYDGSNPATSNAGIKISHLSDLTGAPEVKI